MGSSALWPQPILFTDSCLLQDLSDKNGVNLSSVRIGNDLPIAAPLHVGMPSSGIRPLKAESPQPLNQLRTAARGGILGISSPWFFPLSCHGQDGALDYREGFAVLYG